MNLGAGYCGRNARSGTPSSVSTRLCMSVNGTSKTCVVLPSWISSWRSAKLKRLRARPQITYTVRFWRGEFFLIGEIV
jgi:hypothetical protein